LQIGEVLKSWGSFDEVNIGSIEIVNRPGELERIYFRIPECCYNLSKATKDRVIREVKRDSPEEKVTDFMSKLDSLAFEIYHQTRISKSKLGPIVQRESYLRTAVAIVTITINILLLVLYRNKL
jgi:hypothetical protein